MTDPKGQIVVVRLYGKLGGDGAAEKRTVQPSEQPQTITPGVGYTYLSEVVVEGAPLQSKTVIPYAKPQTVYPDIGFYGLSDVLVEAASGGGGISFQNVDESTLKELIERTATADTDQTVTEIGTYAHCGHTNLKVVDFPVATSIGTYAFADCTNLEAAYFPEVTAVGEYAFIGCSKLSVAYFPTAVTVKIQAFSECTALQSVYAPKLQYLKEYAFSSSGITSVDFPLVAEIPYGAFKDCEALTTVDLAATTFSGNPFPGCSALTTIILRSPTMVDVKGALSDTPIASGSGGVYVPAALLAEYIAANDENNEYHGREVVPSSVFMAIEDHPDICGTQDDAAELETKRNVITRVVTEISNDDIIAVGDYAFAKCTDLATVDLPVVETIGVLAFYECDALQSVSFPVVVSVGKQAFYYCENLSSANLPLARRIGNEAFSRCPLTSINAPSVLGVGAGAFYECPLSSVSMPLLKTIGNHAFYSANYYSRLTTFDFSSAVTIGEEAFMDRTALTGGDFSKLETVGARAFSECAALECTTNLNSLVSVGDEAFYGCAALAVSVNAPNCTSIGERAFYECAALTGASLPNCESIGEEAFFGCASLEADLYAPVCTSLGARAFANTKTTSADFPELETLNGAQFYGCALMSEVNFPKVRNIYRSSNPDSISMKESWGVFEGCAMLTRVTLPSVETIQGSAFRGCLMLEVVDLPSATSIDGHFLYYDDHGRTFVNCISLTALILRNTEQVCQIYRTISGNTVAFANTPIEYGTGYIYVPAALLAEYKAAPGWLHHADQIRAIEDYPEICGVTTEEGEIV